MSEHAILDTILLIVWALMLVMTVKYVLVIMRADNRGEGGLLALTALVLRSTRSRERRYFWIMAAGMVGAGAVLWRRRYPQWRSGQQVWRLF